MEGTYIATNKLLKLPCSTNTAEITVIMVHPRLKPSRRIKDVTKNWAVNGGVEN